MRTLQQHRLPFHTTERGRYLLAYLLDGEVAHYHHTLTMYLADRYHLQPIHTRLGPHVTIKIPFEANAYEAEQLKARLETFAYNHPPQHLTFDGFGRFGFKTAYLDVVKSNASVETVRRCIGDLNEFPWMQQVTHEGNKLHASVARFMTYKKFRRVWRHLKTERVHFKTTVHALTLLKKGNERMWHTEETFSFNPLVSRHTFAREPVLVRR